MPVEEKIKKIVKTIEKVDEVYCDCLPGFCTYTKFLCPLKIVFWTRNHNRSKKKILLEHCLKNKNFLLPLKEFRYFFCLLFFQEVICCKILIEIYSFSCINKLKRFLVHFWKKSNCLFQIENYWINLLIG